LLAILNENARQAPALIQLQVTLDVKQRGQALGIDGLLACGRSGQVRLVCRMLGQPCLDLGSNEREPWCIVRGQKVTQILPCHPDWLPALLGLKVYGHARDYHVVPRPGGLELVEKSVSPAGKPLWKITLIEQTGKRYRVVGHRLEGAGGKVILTCSVLAVQRDPATGLEIPSRLRVTWPAEKVEIRVRLSDLRPLDGSRATTVFRPPGRK
jgi:hypothetical protein